MDDKKKYDVSMLYQNTEKKIEGIMSKWDDF